MKGDWSRIYDENAPPQGQQFLKPWYRLILEMMKATESMHDAMALEVGCGAGAFCQKLSERYKSVVGLDLEKNGIRIAKRRAPAKNTFFVLGDAQWLPFRDEAFELVVCAETLEHLPHYKRAFCEIVKVTKRHGHIAITVPNYLSTNILGEFLWAMWPTKQFKQPHDSHFFNYWNFNRMFKRGNLRRMKMRGVDFIRIPFIDYKVKSRQTKLNNFLCFLDRYVKEFYFLSSNIGILAYKE